MTAALGRGPEAIEHDPKIIGCPGPHPWAAVDDPDGRVALDRVAGVVDLPDVGRREVHHGDTFVPGGDQQLLLHQLLERLADRGAGDAEQLGEPRFPQLFAGQQLSLDDHLPQIVTDAVRR